MKTTVLSMLSNEMLKNIHWWRKNASIRHGHPPDIASQPVEIVETTEKAPSLMGFFAKTALATLVGGGAGAALVMALSGYFFPSEKTEAPPAVIQEVPSQYNSLYQFLEDNGLHLPE
jgi:hypothetical protein